MFRIIIADWRRILGYSHAGLAVLLLLLLIVYRDFARHTCLVDPECQLRALKLLFVLLVYCGGCMVWWAQSRMYDPCRTKLIDTLPLSTYDLNRARILMGFAFLAPGLVCWIAVFSMWRHFGLPIPFWIPVAALLSLITYLVVAMRSLWLRPILPLLFPGLFIPGSENVIRLDLLTQAWPSLILGLFVILFGWWAIRQPPPRWARK